MTEAVHMADMVVTGKTRAIVCFGPATPISGMRPAEYFQVVIDPEMVSPGGDYIRFDQRAAENEIHGWQRVGAMTICEVLEEGPKHELGHTVTMRAIVKEAKE